DRSKSAHLPHLEVCAFTARYTLIRSPPLTTNHPADVPCPLPRRIERVRVSIASPLMQPSPSGRWVGIRIVTFEACPGFTRLTARRILHSPRVPFVTRLRPSRLPDRAARQLPDLSTIVRVEPSSTDGSRLRGALPDSDIRARQAWTAVCLARYRREAGHG